MTIQTWSRMLTTNNPRMDGLIEALHIYDEQNRPILSHTYTSRPPSAANILSLYHAHHTPRPSFIYLPETNPPTLLFSITHANLLFVLTSSSDIEPLLALEFLHRLIDVLEEFLGAPLLSSKIESSYDIVAQLLNEMCDGGAISTTEGNALRDLVEVEGFLGKLLGGINMPSKPGFSGTSNSSSLMQGISSRGAAASSTPALPWRRANVKHTSNEMYVDMVETLSVTLAPSGRPLAAFAHGTIAFTAKISGVPDVLLVLSTPAGKQNFESVMDLPVFHPCVRLARWKESPGELSFVPPDGRFVLAGYEVDLLPFTAAKASSNPANLKLPVNVEVKTSLGPVGAEFEVRVTLTKVGGSSGSSTASNMSGRPAGRLGAGPAFGGSAPSGPTLDDVVVTVPIAHDVRNITDIRASRGDATYSPAEHILEWRIPAKEASVGTATLRCAVVGMTSDDEADGNGFSFDGSKDYDYNEKEEEGSYQSKESPKQIAQDASGQDDKRVLANKVLMPSSTRVSFAVKGWLASGIKVESLTIDSRKSRGLGEGVKPYKGVKYLCVSRGGVEIRC